jgi:hypothetical protein
MAAPRRRGNWPPHPFGARRGPLAAVAYQKDMVSQGGLDAEVSAFLFCRNIFWTFQPFRRILRDRAAPHQGRCEQPLARTGDEKQRRKESAAKVLTMLVSRKFSSPPARLYQGFKEDSASVFLAIQMFFLEKIWIFALRRPVARHSETRRRRLHSPVTRENLSETEPLGFEVGGFRSACGRMLRIRLGMPGTSPGRTREGCAQLQLFNRFFLSRTAVGLSRPSTRRRCEKRQRLASSARRGCPAQGRAGRAEVAGTGDATINFVSPDSPA